jgi:hypothetical protein
MAEYIKREAVKRLVNNNFSGLLAAIDSIPAADVAPVVHGRWIYDKKAQRPYCSVCKEYFYGATNSPMSYCSNCGATMDGGQCE